jgi:pimeloyl-ACP methyl ester carboxylesterase
MREAYRAVAPDPDTFDSFVARTGSVIGRWVGWTDDELRAVTAATLLVIGDTDFARPEHAEQMHQLIPDSDLPVLPRTTHMALVRRAALLGPMISAFLTEPR